MLCEASNLIVCGRSSLTKTEKELEKRFQATFYSEELERYNPLPNYNVAPSHMMPVIAHMDRDHFSPMRWGLIPFWAKDMKIGYKMINARVETLLQKNTFKSIVSRQRCIVPADGFYEWQKTPKGKQAFYIKTKDQEIFSMAGLWEKWKSPEGVEIQSFTVITQAPNTLMEGIHDRMPAILTPEQEDIWLGNDLSPEELIAIIQPYPSELMEAFPVSDKVNNVRNNGPLLIEKVESDKDSGQMSLF